MPGREDFAIIRARLMADDRACAAADLYVEDGLAVELTALSTVVGHIAQLGLWAVRETDDGVLPGSGVGIVAAATATPRSAAKRIIDALMSAGLLRDVARTSDGQGGIYLVGFQDCYEAIIRKRKVDAERKAQARLGSKSSGRRSDVARTSGGRPSDVPRMSERTVPYRTGTDLSAGARGGAPLNKKPEEPRLLPPARWLLEAEADEECVKKAAIAGARLAKQAAERAAKRAEEADEAAKQAADG